ncbi:MAG: hypothetical protein ACJ0BO_01465 [Candidatus Puniceispirillaceae bacterium]
MLPTTPQETKRQLRKGPALGAIRICLDGCKAAYLGVAIGRGLVPNWDRTWQNGTGHIAHSVIPLHTNSKPSQTNLIWIAGSLAVTKTTWFFARGAVLAK